MSAFNRVSTSQVCPNCSNSVVFRVQFKYGDAWQYEYEVGNQIRWGGNDIGAPGAKSVVVDGIAEVCPLCGFGLGP